MSNDRNHAFGKDVPRHNGRPMVKRGAGFTLVELMIVVAIITILAAIAVPSYARYVVKTKRVAAQACLSEYANYMERYYTTNLSYSQAGSTANTLPALDCASAQRSGADYQFDLPKASLTASAFLLTAKPINAQATRETLCGTLSLDQTGARSPTTTGCW